MKNLNSLEQAWKEKLIKDLGLETYNSLFKNSLEDIITSPFYTNNNKTKNAIQAINIILALFSINSLCIMYIIYYYIDIFFI